MERRGKGGGGDDMSTKLLTLQNLQHYHKSLMKYLGTSKLVPQNICTRCGGLLGKDNICEYCGTKYKLVIENKKGK